MRSRKTHAKYCLQKNHVAIQWSGRCIMIILRYIYNVVKAKENAPYAQLTSLPRPLNPIYNLVPVTP